MIKFSPVSIQGNLQKEEKQKKNIKGALAAGVANALVSLSAMPVSSLLVDKMTKLNKSLSKDEVEFVNNGAQKVLEEVTNLSRKGVEIVDVKKGTILEGLIPNTILDMISPIDAVAHGKNAAFIVKSEDFRKDAFENLGIKNNSIIVNKDKFSLATFHEIGHAFNCNNSAFWKTIQKIRIPLMFLAPIIALIPAFTKDTKAQEGQEISKGQKFVNGLRKACPFLAGGAMLPMFAEEMKATLRGNKWAKEVLSSDLAKKVSKGNAWGLISYAAAVGVVALAAFVTKKVKDKADDKMNFKAQVSGLKEKEFKPSFDYHQG